MEPHYLGNKDLLNRKLTAFLASRTIQTDRVLACYDWATSLSPEEDCVVSGFQSPIEKDVLHFLMRRNVPVIVVLARKLYKTVPAELRKAYDEGRVLFISISKNNRNSNEGSLQRNRYVTQLAQKAVFGMMSETSSLYGLYLKLVEQGMNIEIPSHQP